MEYLQFAEYCGQNWLFMSQYRQILKKRIFKKFLRRLELCCSVSACFCCILSLVANFVNCYWLPLLLLSSHRYTLNKCIWFAIMFSAVCLNPLMAMNGIFCQSVSDSGYMIFLFHTFTNLGLPLDVNQLAGVLYYYFGWCLSNASIFWESITNSSFLESCFEIYLMFFSKIKAYFFPFTVFRGEFIYAIWGGWMIFFMCLSLICGWVCSQLPFRLFTVGNDSSNVGQ